MARRNLRSSRLHGSTLLPDDREQDPMGSLGNLMDVMLVFACGLLLALITNWNVDITGQTVDQSISQVEGDLQEVQEGINENDGQYEEMGQVYRDKDTGEIYIVTG